MAAELGTAQPQLVRLSNASLKSFFVKNGECGEPGEFTHLTPWFVVNHDGEAQNTLGRTDKVRIIGQTSILQFQLLDSSS